MPEDTGQCLNEPEGAKVEDDDGLHIVTDLESIRPVDEIRGTKVTVFYADDAHSGVEYLAGEQFSDACEIVDSLVDEPDQILYPIIGFDAHDGGRWWINMSYVVAMKFENVRLVSGETLDKDPVRKRPRRPATKQKSGE